MMDEIRDVPGNVFAVVASGVVTTEDYKRVMLPGLEAQSKKEEKINFILVLDTDISNLSIGAWIQDMWAGIKHLTNWNRVAIVTDQKGVEKFTDMFSYVVPGEFKGFSLAELNNAKSWAAGVPLAA